MTIGIYDKGKDESLNNLLEMPSTKVISTMMNQLAKTPSMKAVTLPINNKNNNINNMSTINKLADLSFNQQESPVQQVNGPR